MAKPPISNYPASRAVILHQGNFDQVERNGAVIPALPPISGYPASEAVILHARPNPYSFKFSFNQRNAQRRFSSFSILYLLSLYSW